MREKFFIHNINQYQTQLLPPLLQLRSLHFHPDQQTTIVVHQIMMCAHNWFIHYLYFYVGGKPLTKPPNLLDFQRQVASKARDRWKKVGIKFYMQKTSWTQFLKIVMEIRSCVTLRYSLWRWEKRPNRLHLGYKLVEVLKSPIVEENKLAIETLLSGWAGDIVLLFLCTMMSCCVFVPHGQLLSIATSVWNMCSKIYWRPRGDLYELKGWLILVPFIGSYPVKCS